MVVVIDEIMYSVGFSEVNREPLVQRSLTSTIHCFTEIILSYHLILPSMADLWLSRTITRVTVHSHKDNVIFRINWNPPNCGISCSMVLNRNVERFITSASVMDAETIKVIFSLLLSGNSKGWTFFKSFGKHDCRFHYITPCKDRPVFDIDHRSVASLEMNVNTKFVPKTVTIVIFYAKVGPKGFRMLVLLHIIRLGDDIVALFGNFLIQLLSAFRLPSVLLTTSFYSCGLIRYLTIMLSVIWKFEVMNPTARSFERGFV